MKFSNAMLKTKAALAATGHVIGDFAADKTQPLRTEYTAQKNMRQLLKEEEEIAQTEKKKEEEAFCLRNHDGDGRGITYTEASFDQDCKEASKFPEDYTLTVGDISAKKMREGITNPWDQD